MPSIMYRNKSLQMEGASTSTASNQGQSVASGSAGTSDTPPEEIGDFLQTGRTGRRNALPDILDEKTGHASTAELPCQMEKLSCSGKYLNFIVCVCIHRIAAAMIF